jgi:hypothetical protein
MTESRRAAEPNRHDQERPLRDGCRCYLDSADWNSHSLAGMGTTIDRASRHVATELDPIEPELAARPASDPSEQTRFGADRGAIGRKYPIRQGCVILITRSAAALA